MFLFSLSFTYQWALFYGRIASLHMSGIYTWQPKIRFQTPQLSNNNSSTTYSHQPPFIVTPSSTAPAWCCAHWASLFSKYILPPLLSRLSKISPHAACFVFAQVAPAAFFTQLHWRHCGYMLWISEQPTRGTVSNNYRHNKNASCFLFSTPLLIPCLYEHPQFHLMKWHQHVKKFQWQLSAPSSVISGEEDGVLMGPTPQLSLLYSIWTCTSRRDNSCAAVMCRSMQRGISTSLRGHSHCHGMQRRATFSQKGTIFEHRLLVMEAVR